MNNIIDIPESVYIHENACFGIIFILPFLAYI